ncbi:Anthranilate synthase component [Musa troglodytarum]|uniref:anthranilate synthase n=1 Tax=Musa troglodytarum TaxID=320322 RepID=A0A9E7GHN9_9LILI|nr:Anthranilate synthase component [Musa troglodytarum]
MASSLLSLTPKLCIAPRTISNPRRLFTSHAAALPSPPSLGVGRGCLALGRSRSMVARSSAVAVANARDSRPIVVIDNYDSFTYNLCQVSILMLEGKLDLSLGLRHTCPQTPDLAHHGHILVVVLLIGSVLDSRYGFSYPAMIINPRGILISPGPGAPQDSGISLQAVLELGPSMPLFGVCMGLQCIGEAFGGKIVRAPSGVMHGKSSLVYYDETLEDSLFYGLPNPFTACRYHSLVIENDSFPSDALEIMAWTEDGLVMAARHKKHKHIQGVQFHPESIMTPEGKTMVPWSDGYEAGPRPMAYQHMWNHSTFHFPDKCIMIVLIP